MTFWLDGSAEGFRDWAGVLPQRWSAEMSRQETTSHCANFIRNLSVGHSFDSSFQVLALYFCLPKISRSDNHPPLAASSDCSRRAEVWVSRLRRSLLPSQQLLQAEHHVVLVMEPTQQDSAYPRAMNERPVAFYIDMPSWLSEFIF